MSGTFLLAKRVAFGLLLTLAVYAGVGRVAVSIVPAWKDDLLARASDTLGAPVSVREVSSSWRYLSPALDLHGIELTDDVRVEQLRVELDLLGSFAALAPRFRIDIAGVCIDLVSDERGWHVASLPRGEMPIDLAAVLAWIDRLDLMLRDVEVRMDAGSSRRLLRLTRGGVFQDGTHTAVDLPLEIDGGAVPARIALSGRYVGGLGERGRLGGGLHLAFSNLDLPFLLLPRAANLIPEVTLNGKAWVGFRFGETRLALELETGALRTSSGELFSEPSKLIVSALGSGGRWIGEIEQASLLLGGGEVDLGGTGLVAEDGASALQLPGIDVEPVIEGLLAFPDVMPQRVVDILTNGAPRGLLQSVHVFADGEAPFSVVGHIEGAHLTGDNAVPSFRNQSGLFSLGTAGGYIEVNSIGPSELRFGAFDDYWQFDRARGRVSFVPITGGGMAISSGVLEVGLGELQARGRFRMNAVPDKALQTWALELGIVNAELLEASIYLPRTLSPRFRTWLDQGVRGGTSLASGMLFHGAPARVAPSENKTYELYMDVAELDLTYHLDWPKVEGVRAVINAGNWGARVRGATGGMFGSHLSHVDVDVIAAGGVIDRVEVAASLEGPIDDGIQFINQTPLANLTSRVTETWFGSGPIVANAKVMVPFKAQEDRPTEVDVSVRLQGNELVMPNYQLDVHDFTTELTYSNDKGLSALSYAAKLLGGPVSGNIESDVRGNRGEIRVVAAGEVSVPRLHRWSRQPIFTHVSGELAYASTLHVPFGTGAMPPYVVVESDLIGVASRLPAPMDKHVEKRVDFRYEHTFEADSDLIAWDYDDEVIGRLRVVDGNVVGGEVTFGLGRLLTNSVERMVIIGELEYADYEVWSELIEAMQMEASSDLESGFADALEGIEVSVVRLDAFGLELSDAGIGITRLDDAWRIVVSNSQVEGVIRVPDQEGEPLMVDLAYIRVDGDEDESIDPFEDIDPREYLPINFSTRELRVGDDDYGSWQLAFRPDEEGAVLNDVRASTRGLQLVANSTITWRPDAAGGNSTFQGTVYTDDLGRALTEFGYASSIEGEGMQFGADIAWPGSPAMIDILNVSGQVAIESGKGRFVQVEANGTGALKLLGIFDFASLARRLSFDFSDIVESGYSFDNVSGVVDFDEGRVNIVDSVVIEGSSSIFKVGGSIDLTTEALDSDMIVTLPVSRNLPWYAAYSAIATGPLMGAGVFIAQKVFEDQINAMSSAKYEVSGTLDKPQIEFVSIFSDTVREGAAHQEEHTSNPDHLVPLTPDAELVPATGG